MKEPGSTDGACRARYRFISGGEIEKGHSTGFKEDTTKGILK